MAETPPTPFVTETTPVRESRNTTFGGAEAFGSFLGNFNPSTDSGVVPLHQRTIMLIGVQGGGKSTLIESCPYAIILDADSSGTSNPHRQAMRLPDRTKPTAPGRLGDIEWDGFGFDYMRAVCQTLIDKRAAGWEEPCMVAFDLFDSLVDWRRMKLEKDRGDKIKNMHGMEAWGVIYDSVRDLVFSLQEARIGVILSTHASHGDRQISADERVTEVMPTISNKMWGRISRRVDECFYLFSEDAAVTELRPVLDRKGKPRLDEQGQPMMREVKGEARPTYRILTNKLKANSDSMYMYMKRRLPLEDLLTVEIGNYDGWGTVIEPAYEAAIQRFEAGMTDTAD